MVSVLAWLLWRELRPAPEEAAAVMRAPVV
jgi:hypothetical protein